MMGYLFLFSGILGAILVLTLVYYLLIVATEELEPHPGISTTLNTETESIYARNPKIIDAHRAVIHCATCPPVVPNRYKAAGYIDCNVLDLEFGGNLLCMKGCLGLGSCAKICPNDAIVLRHGEVFISDNCTGCGSCIPVCPKNLIEIIPVSGLKSIPCAATGNKDSDSLCPVALDKEPYTIDYRKFRKTGFKLPGN